MKQLLFLLLFPCLALAQYPGNGNQKITLGEQSTADGLVYRGVANDTNVITPFSDTSAYIILDTVNSKFYHYNRTTTYWAFAGGGVSVTSFSAGTTGLTPTGETTGAVTLGGTLAVANGGTNRTTMPAGYILHGDGTSVDTAIGLFWDRTNRRIGINTNTPNVSFEVWQSVSENTFGNGFRIVDSNGDKLIRIGHNNTAGVIGTTYTLTEPYTPLALQTSDENRLYILANGDIGIGTITPTEKLHVVGNARITGAYSVTTGSAANVFVTTDGVLQRSTSSIKYKTDVEDYSKGLKEVMQLRPVTFKSINSNNDKTYAGFIAEELADLKLNELLENNDSGEPDAISYAYMVTLLTKAIQEQQEQISLLKKRLLILENK
jgi:hypothetical protein